LCNLKLASHGKHLSCGGSLVFQNLAPGRPPHSSDYGYPDYFRTQPWRGSWLRDMRGRLTVR